MMNDWSWEADPNWYLGFAFQAEQNGKVELGRAMRAHGVALLDWMDEADARWKQEFGRYAPENLEEAIQLAGELGLSAEEVERLGRDKGVLWLEGAIRKASANSGTDPDGDRATRKKLPSNPDIGTLAVFIQNNDAEGESMASLARQFTYGK
jgi:hypothetical protein